MYVDNRKGCLGSCAVSRDTQGRFGVSRRCRPRALTPSSRARASIWRLWVGKQCKISTIGHFPTVCAVQDASYRSRPGGQASRAPGAGVFGPTGPLDRCSRPNRIGLYGPTGPSRTVKGDHTPHTTHQTPTPHTTHHCAGAQITPPRRTRRRGLRARRR